MLKLRPLLSFLVSRTVLGGKTMMSFGRVLRAVILSGSTLTCCVGGHLYAEDTSRFYTVIDELGHMRSVRKEESSAGAQKPTIAGIHRTRGPAG